MCLQGSVLFPPGKNNRKSAGGLEVSEQLNTVKLQVCQTPKWVWELWEERCWHGICRIKEISYSQRWICSMLDVQGEHFGQKTQNSQKSCEFSTDFSFYKYKSGQMRLQKTQDGPVSSIYFHSACRLSSAALSWTLTMSWFHISKGIKSTARIVATGYGKAQLYSVSPYPARISIIFSKINLRNKTQCLKPETNESKWIADENVAWDCLALHPQWCQPSAVKWK